jgi:DNA-binding IclR family transcriptional regulator
MAAALPDDRRAALLGRLALPRLTPRTITSRTMVKREWARVRRIGVAVNREETIQGAIFLASPVFDANAYVCGALSVGIPKARHSGRIERAIAAALKDSSRRLSDTLAAAGYAHNAGVAPSLRSEQNRLTLLAG